MKYRICSECSSIYNTNLISSSKPFLSIRLRWFVNEHLQSDSISFIIHCDRPICNIFMENFSAIGCESKVSAVQLHEFTTNSAGAGGLKGVGITNRE
ncbi:MAG: hypothetical protein EZS28_009480 [Streblomastix strix]|uniref:Uncharacterized protein n=1 Tax=Streblomastix strix TaxID=222440 RepID=A0A5J4WJB8_9EUKA|nr:MAG: hypothetical protein EZS28_009480 [Streblomastix strix]